MLCKGDGSCGDPVAFGEIVRQKAGVKLASTTRQGKFISQVTSSRLLGPSVEGEDQLHNTDEKPNDEEDDAFFKDQDKFDDPPGEETTA